MDKRETVISTARELFEKYGYKKVSMDEIAQVSHVTKKTIYTYFKDKASLFEYFIQEELNHMKSEIESEKQAGKSLEDIVSTSVYRMLTYRKNSGLMNNIIKEAATDDKARVYLDMFDREIINYIQNLINEGIERKEVKPCDSKLVAFIIFKVCIAIMLEYDDLIDEKRATAELTSILKQGLLN